jgi:hypothetical protein
MRVECPIIHHNVILYFEGEDRISKISRDDLMSLGREALRNGFAGYGRGYITEGGVETPFLTIAKERHDGVETTEEICLNGSFALLHWLAGVALNPAESNEKLTDCNVSAAMLVSTAMIPGSLPDCRPFTATAQELQAHILEIQSDKLHQLTTPE